MLFYLPRRPCRSLSSQSFSVPLRCRTLFFSCSNPTYGTVYMAYRTPHTRQTSGASLLSSVHTGLDDSGHRLATEIIDDHWSSLSRDDVSMQNLISARLPDKVRSVAQSTSPASTTTHPQKHSKLSRAPRFRSCRGWSAELVSLMTAFCILATIVVLLYHYNGKRLADTPARPSLNTIVNILSTALTALVMLATTAGNKMFVET